MTSRPIDVSIVLPTYNGAKYLRESVASCLAQTLTRWELIVVDDCSTDETPRLLAELAASDERIRAIRHEQNRKLPGALNTGFAAARGRYLTWTSDDNAYRPQALERMAATLDQRPEAGFLYAEMSEIDHLGREIKQRAMGPPKQLVNGNCVGACFLYRREVRDAVGDYADDLYLAEDYDYWLRVASQFRMFHLAENLYRYRYHEQSLTSRYQERIERAAENCFGRNLDSLAWASARQVGRRMLRIASSALARGDTASARHWFGLAARRSPLALVRSPGRTARLLSKMILDRGRSNDDAHRPAA